MSQLDSIIQVTIRRDTATIETAAFNIPLVLATFTNFSERVRQYSDIDEILELFGSSSNVYKMATALFGQSGNYGRPPYILVGRRQVDSVVGTIPTAVEGAVYTVTINETDFSYTAVALDTAADIVAGLKTAYDAAPISGITFTDNLDGTFDAAVTVAGTAWSIVATDNITIDLDTPTETYPEALAEINQENNDWYCVNCEDHTDVVIEAIAEYIESQEKIYITSSSVSAIKAATQTDIAASLRDQAYSRTAIIYLPTADTEFPECAWVGGMLPQIVGAADWDFKRATGVTVANLTETEITNIKGKECNYFMRIVGVNIFQEGDMVDGRPIYEIIIKDWLKARMQERIFSRLVNNLKLPYDRKGVAAVESDIRSVLAEMNANGGIDSILISSPDPFAASVTDRQQGILRTFKFSARYIAGVRQIIIDGTLTV